MNKKKSAKKLLILSTSLGRGGADKQILNIARGVGNFRVKIISLTPLGDMARYGEAGGLDIRAFPLRGRGMLRNFRRLAAFLRCWRPDIVLSFMFHATMAARLFKFLGIINVHISSVRNEKFGGRAREILFRKTSFLDRCITVNSVKAAEKLVRRGVLDRRKTVIVPNGIAAAGFKQAVFQNRVFTWITVARFVPNKDYGTLIRAVKRLAKEKPFRVLAVGTGVLFESVKERISGEGLDDVFRLTGARSDIPQLLAGADAFVYSSAWDGMPNAIMEAMAAGLPVVSTDAGGTSELVIPGKTGYLVKIGDDKNLADRMQYVMHLRPKERTALGRTGRRRIIDEYDIQKTIKKWESLFFNCLG